MKCPTKPAALKLVVQKIFQEQGFKSLLTGLARSVSVRSDNRQ